VTNGSGDFQDKPSPKDPDLESLDHRIAEARAVEETRVGGQLPGLAAVSGAKSVAATMIGYPLGGIIIGYGLDQLFGTMPWITIGLMFAAFIAGCFQVMTKVGS
jgi:ATP synthase protein I